MNSKVEKESPDCLAEIAFALLNGGTIRIGQYNASDDLRTVTSKVLAERYPVKGSMPQAVVQQLYQLRAWEVERLSKRDVIVATDVQGSDRGGRAMVAISLFEKCDDVARHTLLHDEHPHVRSCAVLSQSHLQTFS